MSSRVKFVPGEHWLLRPVICDTKSTVASSIEFPDIVDALLYVEAVYTSHEVFSSSLELDGRSLVFESPSFIFELYCPMVWRS